MSTANCNSKNTNGTSLFSIPNTSIPLANLVFQTSGDLNKVKSPNSGSERSCFVTVFSY